MKFIETSLKGAYVIELEPFIDHRGMFARIFCKEEFKKINLRKDIVQINHSITIKKGSIRGMHYQLPPTAEIKNVKVLKGSICDVIVDIRQGSPTFLKWHAEILSDKDSKVMYIPEGFAHGFQALKDNCELLYFNTEFYSPQNERRIRYDDNLIGIKWPLKVTDISEKDKKCPLLDKIFAGIKCKI